MEGHSWTKKNHRSLNYKYLIFHSLEGYLSGFSHSFDYPWRPAIGENKAKIRVCLPPCISAHRSKLAWRIEFLPRSLPFREFLIRWLPRGFPRSMPCCMAACL